MHTSKYGKNEHPMLEPDIMLPAQFFGNVPSLIDKSGEYRLLWAVLADAIKCFQTFVHARTRKGRRLFEEVECWIMHQEIQPTVADDAKPRPFVFKEVCDVLGLEAEYLRAGLRRWQHAQTSRSVSLGEVTRCDQQLRRQSPMRRYRTAASRPRMSARTNRPPRTLAIPQTAIVPQVFRKNNNHPHLFPAATAAGL